MVNHFLRALDKHANYTKYDLFDGFTSGKSARAMAYKLLKTGNYEMVLVYTERKPRMVTSGWNNTKYFNERNKVGMMSIVNNRVVKYDDYESDENKQRIVKADGSFGDSVYDSSPYWSKKKMNPTVAKKMGVRKVTDHGPTAYADGVPRFRRNW